MIIYLDESYDNNKKYFILGALFNSHHKFLLREIKNIKTAKNFFNNDGTFKEIKYNNCFCKENFDVARMMIDSFLKNTSYFRAIVIETARLDLKEFGKYNEQDKIKWARAYKKFAEMLIRYNSSKIFNGVLLTDGLTRCDGDLFIEKMREINPDYDPYPTEESETSVTTKESSGNFSFNFYSWFFLVALVVIFLIYISNR